MKKCAYFIVLLLVFSMTISYNYIDTVKSDDETTILWLSVDWHMDRNDPSGAVGTPWYGISWTGYYQYGNAHDAVNDTNAMNVDYAWIVGDMISWFDYSNGYPGEPEGWRRFGTAWSNLTVTYAKNFTIGNHDGRFFDEEDTDCVYQEEMGLPRPQGEGGEWYYYDMGNTSGGGVRFICMADEDTADGSQSGNGVISSTQHDWVESKVEDAYDNNLSVFIFMHQKQTSSWFSGSESSSYCTGSPITDIMNYWNGQGKPISLYACGHSHDAITESQDWIESHYGTTCLLICSISCYESDNDIHYPHSRYLYFTEGSTEVTIKSYNHTGNNFIDAVEYTFDLEYPWSPVGEEPPEEPSGNFTFDDICGLENNSDISMYDSVWGNISLPEPRDIPQIDTSEQIVSFEEFNIRVARDGGFTNIIANETHSDIWFNLSTDVSEKGSLYFDYRAKVKVVSN